MMMPAVIMSGSSDDHVGIGRRSMTGDDQHPCSTSVESCLILNCTFVSSVRTKITLGDFAFLFDQPGDFESRS